MHSGSLCYGDTTVITICPYSAELSPEESEDVLFKEVYHFLYFSWVFTIVLHFDNLWFSINTSAKELTKLIRFVQQWLGY